MAKHHHCLPTKSVWMDTMIIDNNEEFMAVIGQYPQIKAVVHGHIHQVLEYVIDDLKVFGTPSTCFQFTPESHVFSLDDSSPAYRKIELYPNGTVASSVCRLLEPLVWLAGKTQSY